MLIRLPERANPSLKPATRLEPILSAEVRFDRDLEAFFANEPKPLCEKVQSAAADEKTEYPGPSTPNLDGLHPDALSRFRDADEAYYNATSETHLQIESGFRTVYRQAELYACWRLGEAGCNPADIPGASIHNSGLAIDIRNARDDQVIAALDSNGWDRTVMPREPWHWEPVGLVAHTAAVQRRQRMRQAGSIARRWQSEWEAARTKNDQRNTSIADYNTRVDQWQPEWEQHQREVESFQARTERYNQRVDEHNSERRQFAARADRFNAEVEALEELRERIESMEPSPERNQLIEEYNRRASAAQAEQQELLRLQSRLEADANQLERERSELEDQERHLVRENSRLVAEAESLVRLRDDIERLGQQIEAHLDTARTLLRQIAQEVHP